MAIIYSYPVITPTADDLLLGTDQGGDGKPTKNFTIQSIVDLLQAGATGLGAVIEINSSAKNAAGGNQSATDFLNIQGTGSASFNSFTDGNMTITGGIGNGFTSIRSTDFVGNITGIVKAGSSIESTVTGVTQNAGDNSLKLATTAYVDGKVDPSILTFLGTNGGNQTVNLAAQTFSILGTANQIETDGTAQTLNIKFPTAGVVLPDGSTATTQAATDDSTKVATTAFVRDYDDTQDLDFTGDTGTSSVLLNSQTLDFEGTTNQVTTAVTAQKVKFSLPTSVTIGGTFTGTTFAGDLLGTINTATTGVTQNAGDDSTKIATTAYVDTAAGAKILQYQGDTGGPFDLNLKDDDLDIAGGSNISTTAATVATNLGVITIDLNDSVTISGTSKADTFTTTAGTATWATTVLAGFTSITSDTFIGDSTASATDFQGNASSATKLGSSDGTIQILAGSGVTQGVSSSAVIYTNGGDIELTTSLINTTVTAKTLQGLPTPAAATVVASDTILQGFGKLQSQINGIADGLQFQGTWNANIDEGGAGATPNGTPALTSGGGEASSGTTDATTANELVDSTKNFTTAPNVVAVGDKVINQVDGQEALVNDIANAASGRLGLAADIMLDAEAYIIDKPPFITAGHYYVVNTVGATTAKNATLNGIQDWQIGDWVIASTTNVWQKLNNSAVEGSGTENRLPKWTAAVSTLVDSGIIDNGTTIKLENDTELGGAAGDAISSVGVHTIDEQLILKKGLALNASYGTSGQVLTSAGASADVPTWTTPTTGVVESITGGTGITVDDSSNPGTAAIPVVSIDYTGTDNVVLGAGTAVTPVGADTIIINDATSGNAVKALISNLPFNNYSWDLNVDGGTASTVGDGDEVDFLSGTGIIQSLSTRDVTTALRYEDENADPSSGALNFIDATATVAPVATDFLVFSDQFNTSTKNVVKKATIADIIDLGNETLAEVLTNGNTTGSTDISVTSANIVFQDSSAGGNGRALFGASEDLQIFHDGTNSYVAEEGTGNLLITTNGTSVQINKGTTENMAEFIVDGAVNLYYDSAKKFETTSTGVSVTGGLTAGTGNFSGNVELKSDAGGATKFLRIWNEGTVDASDDALITWQTQASRTYSMGIHRDSGLLTITNQDASVASGELITVDTNGNTVISGNLTVDGAIIHGGGSSASGKGGTFTGSLSFSSGATIHPLFSIKRPVTGSIIVQVMLTSGNSAAVSSSKAYTVAMQHSTVPVYNKLIDTGPKGTNDFDVQWTGGTTNTDTTSIASTTDTIRFSSSGVSFLNVNGTAVSGTGIPAGTVITDTKVGSSTVVLSNTVNVAAGATITFDNSDILICRAEANTTSQTISYTAILGFDEQTIATVKTATTV